MSSKFYCQANLVFQHVGIVILTETKLDTSFPTAQFLMGGFHKLFRLDATLQSGCLLVNIKGYIPARKFEAYKLSFNTEAIFFDKPEEGKMVV